MAIGANITVWFPILAVPIGGATVPISLQTFFAIMAGFTLGRALGSLSMMTYMFVGVLGVPVFAGMKAGPMVIFSPTGGFILSFIFVAFIVGWISERKNQHSTAFSMFAAFVGLFVNYMIGVSYMYISMNLWLELPITYSVAWVSMVPFLIKDFILACCAAMFMVRIANIIPRFTSQVVAGK